jgi:pimeloyl-ACP methyl ester carboxylesterase
LPSVRWRASCLCNRRGGPPLVKSANWMNHLEYDWESPIWHHLLEGLARNHTLVRYDARGNGLSDWDVDELSLDAWVSDLETVVDAIGIKRFPLLGVSQGCAISIAYAVRHPERLSHLILYGGFAKTTGVGRRAKQVGCRLRDRHASQRCYAVTALGHSNPHSPDDVLILATLDYPRWPLRLCPHRPSRSRPEARLDAIYVIRTAVPAEDLSAAAFAPFGTGMPIAFGPMSSCACSPIMSNGICARRWPRSCSTTPISMSLAPSAFNTHGDRVISAL